MGDDVKLKAGVKLVTSSHRGVVWFFAWNANKTILFAHTPETYYAYINR
jgi:hypothetical protein